MSRGLEPGPRRADRAGDCAGGERPWRGARPSPARVGEGASAGGVEPLVRLERVTKVYRGAGLEWSFPRAAFAGGFLRRVMRRWGNEGRGTSARGEPIDAPVHVTAVREVSMEIVRGEFLAVAGPSGSGKSTLLNLIGALDAPTSGEVFYEGRPLSGMSQNELADLRLRMLGFVFQAYNLIPVLSAVENVEYVLTLQRIPRGERAARALEALRWVGLDSEAHRRPDMLSGGQQQRVAVARAIVHRPALVLADEPTANLDSRTAKTLLELMSRLNAEHGITFVFSSHDPQVLASARRVLHIRDGSLQDAAE